MSEIVATFNPFSTYLDFEKTLKRLKSRNRDFESNDYFRVLR